MSKRPQESDVEFIKALAELLRENDLTEIEVSRSYGEDNALDVRVARQAAVMQATSPATPSPAPPVLQHTAAIAGTQPAAGTVRAIDPADDPGVVASPMAPALAALQITMPKSFKPNNISFWSKCAN